MIYDPRESDAQIVIDDLLRKAGWDPADKSMVETEVPVLRSGGAAYERGGVLAGVSPSAGRDTFGRADYLLRDQRGRALAVNSLFSRRDLERLVEMRASRKPLATIGIPEPAPEGNPAQLIRETLALEREIVTGLEKLLKEIEE